MGVRERNMVTKIISRPQHVKEECIYLQRETERWRETEKEICEGIVREGRKERKRERENKGACVTLSLLGGKCNLRRLFTMLRKTRGVQEQFVQEQEWGFLPDIWAVLRLSVCLSVHLSISPSVSLSVHPSTLEKLPFHCLFRCPCKVCRDIWWVIGFFLFNPLLVFMCLCVIIFHIT